MADNTLYQKLIKTLNLKTEGPKFNIDYDKISKLSGSEFETKKLEAQQYHYLQTQWKKIDNELYQKAVYYEPTRMASYYDYEAMEYCIFGDTKIATPNGFITIKELADKGRDYEFVTYAYDHNTKKVVPAIARNAHYTRDEMTYKITFDDGSHIIATEEHRFLKRDGVFEKLKDLKIGDSMMPFYRKSFYNNQNYNWVYTCNSNEGHNGWVAEHNLIAEWFYRDINENEEVHHIDFNGKNNNPENLKIWDRSEHRAYHARLNNERLWSNPEYRKKMSKVARRKGKNNPSYIPIDFNLLIKTAKIYGNQLKCSKVLKISCAKIIDELRMYGYKDWNDFVKKHNITIKRSEPDNRHIPWDNIINAAKQKNTLVATATHLGVKKSKLESVLRNNGYKNWGTFMEAYGMKKSKTGRRKVTKKEDNVINHKIVSIEPYGIKPVYDLTVPGYKNFATDTIFSHNTPEIAVSLDIFADEATTAGPDGKILTIHSESNRIKEELTDLFENKLDINTNLVAWARNLVKYGDNFIYNKIVPKHGIIGCMQLPNIEITRSEPGFVKVVSMEDENKLKATKFFWKDKNIDFNSFEISHFRLMGDDRRLPYGTCLKYNTRIETKDGFKEIKDIKINDLIYCFDTKTQIKKLTKVLDVVNSGIKKTYKISTQHNFVDASEEHRILYFDTNYGEFKYKNVLDFKIGDLLVISKEKNVNKEIPINKNKPLDNKNGYWNNIDLIPDFVDVDFARLFGHLIGDGWINNDSVYIALSEHKTINDRYISYLNKITSRNIKFNGGEHGKSQAICNSKMLSIILERMGFTGKYDTKRIPQWVYGASTEIRRAFLDGLIDADGSIFIDKWDCLRYSIELSNNELINDVKILVQSLGLKSGKINGRLRKNGCIGNRKFKTQKESFYFYFYDSKTKQKVKYDTDHRLSDDFILEPIKSIEVSGEHETHDIYVENENHNFYANGIVVHNSLLEKVRRIWKQLLLSEDAMMVYRVTRAPERRIYKVYVGNMDDKDVDAYVDKIANNFKRVNMVSSETGQQDTRYNPLAVDQDYFIPVRDPSLASPIDTLPGAQNLGEIADITYVQNKLLAALRVPKAFIGFEEATGDGKNLAILDIRFARAIHRVQKALVQELNKMAIIHLFLKGYHDDLSNFTLSLTNPSTQADILKIENWRDKIDLYISAVTKVDDGFAPMSVTLAKKEILGMSADDIKLDIQRQVVEYAGVEEMRTLADLIKQTGLFRDLYRIYSIDPNNTELQVGDDDGEEPTGGGMGGGGAMSVGSFDTDDIDIGDDFTEPLGGDESEEDEGEEEEEIDFGALSEAVKRNRTKLLNKNKPNNKGIKMAENLLGFSEVL